MANQFSRRGPAERIKKHHDESTKDKIRAEMLAKRLYKYANAKGKQAEKYRMDSVQVQAAKVLIDRGKPALQAVEQTVKNEYDSLSDDEIREHVKALISLNPWLLDEFKPGIRDLESSESSTNEPKTAASQQ